MTTETAAQRIARIRAELKQTEAEDHPEEIEYRNGDLFDEDSGEHLGTIDVKDAHDTKEVDTMPASLSVFMNGYFYVFTVQRRYKQGEDNGEAATRIQV
jgi:ferric iron reductase protein FhuF